VCAQCSVNRSMRRNSQTRLLSRGTTTLRWWNLAIARDTRLSCMITGDRNKSTKQMCSLRIPRVRRLHMSHVSWHYFLVLVVSLAAQFVPFASPGGAPSISVGNSSLSQQVALSFNEWLLMQFTDACVGLPAGGVGAGTPCVVARVELSTCQVDANFTCLGIERCEEGGVAMGIEENDTCFTLDWFNSSLNLCHWSSNARCQYERYHQRVVVNASGGSFFIQYAPPEVWVSSACKFDGYTWVVALFCSMMNIWKQ